MFFENGRLIFAPENDPDRRELSDWWAQLQTLGGADGKPTISAVTAEKALVVFLPQR